MVRRRDVRSRSQSRVERQATALHAKSAKKAPATREALARLARRTAKDDAWRREAEAKGIRIPLPWPPPFLNGEAAPDWLSNVRGDFPPDAVIQAEIRARRSVHETASGPSVVQVPCFDLPGDVE